MLRVSGQTQHIHHVPMCFLTRVESPRASLVAARRMQILTGFRRQRFSARIGAAGGLRSLCPGTPRSNQGARWRRLHQDIWAGNLVGDTFCNPNF